MAIQSRRTCYGNYPQDSNPKLWCQLHSYIDSTQGKIIFLEIKTHIYPYIYIYKETLVVFFSSFALGFLFTRL